MSIKRAFKKILSKIIPTTFIAHKIGIAAPDLQIHQNSPLLTLD